MIDLRELWIDGFGCLRSAGEPFRFERDRINLLLDDNEAGKTTLQMAILACLYGIESHKGKLKPEAVRSLLRPHHDHWIPITGEPFGARLRIELHRSATVGLPDRARGEDTAGTSLAGPASRGTHGQRELELRWDFASAGGFHVLDLGTNQEVTAELCPGDDPQELGRRLLGLTLEEFTKTCLVRQDDLGRVRDPKGLDSLVQRAADTQAGDTTVAAAQASLREALRSYPGVMLKDGGRVENEIKRLNDEVDELQARLDQLEAARASIASEDAEFQRLVAERDRLRHEECNLEYLGQAAEHDELRQRIDEADKRRAALAQLEAEHDRLAGLQGFPADQADPLTQWQVARRGLLANAEQAERTIAELHHTALEPARHELEGLRRLAAATQGDVQAIAELLGKTRDFEAREDRLRHDTQREEAQLTARGASVEELDRLEERFGDLPPDDGQFLMDHERTAAQTASELEEVKRRSLEATLRVDRIMEERGRLRDTGRRYALAGLITTAGAVVGAGILMALLHPVVGTCLGVAGLIAAGWLLLKGHNTAAAADSLRSEELAQARLDLTQLDHRREELVPTQEEHAARLARLAQAYGYEQAEVLLDDYTSLDELRRLCGTLLLLRKHQRDMAAEREQIEREVASRFAAWGEDLPPGILLSRALGELQGRMARSLHLRAQIDEWSRRVADETTRRDQFRREAEELTAKIRALFTAAGLADAPSIEKGSALFGERLQQYRRLRELSDILIPQARSAVVPQKEIDTWRAHADRLHRTIATLREERPGLLSLQAKKSSFEYKEQLTPVRAAIEDLRAKVEDTGHKVVDILRAYHAERPKVEERLAERRQQLARAQRHAAALELAIQVLEGIGREVHGRWAEELNRSTGEFLQRISPTLSDLKFDNRLCFGVWHSRGQTPVPSTETSPILSAGTWDQLCLAVRLGLADFVARRGCGGLLLLDDPFAHFDDVRFEAAVRLLAELTSTHQILLFSCQRQRFEWLGTRDPGWFDAHIAARNVRPAAPPPSS